MKKEIVKKINKLDQQRATKVQKRDELTAEINNLDTVLKELNALLKQYEKLEENATAALVEI